MLRRLWEASTRQPVLIFFLLLGGLTLRPTDDPDLWWHIRVGQLIANSGLPQQDVFSYTATANEWIVHEWLSDWFMGRIYDWVGLPGLSLAFAGLAALAWLLLYRRCAGRPFVALSIVALGALAADSFGGARPQVLNLLFFALFLFVLEGQRRPAADSRQLFWLVPLTALWANFHSGFLAGIALLLVYLVGETAAPQLGLSAGRWPAPARRRLPLILILSLALSLVNPHTYRLLLFPLQTLGSSVIQNNLAEWHSPDFHLPYTRYFLALFFLGLFSWAPAARAGQRPPAAHVLLYLGTAAAGFMSIRHIPLFAAAAVIVVSRSLAPLLAERLQWRLALAGAIAALALALGTGPIYLPLLPAGALIGEQLWSRLWLNERWLVFLQRPWGVRLAGNLALFSWLAVLLTVLAVGWRAQRVLAGNEDAIAARFPTAAVVYIKESGLDDGRIFNDYGWGGYLIWQDIPVFIDGRTELYGNDFFAGYITAYYGRPGWDDLLRDNAVTYALVQPAGPLATLLTVDTGWERVYADSQAQIYQVK